MEGAAIAQRQRLDLATFTAWHTAIFALNGYGGRLKGKSLADFLIKDGSPKSEAPLEHAQAIHFFQGMKARGFPVEITRIPRNEIN